MMRGMRAASANPDKRIHSLTCGYETLCEPVSAWLARYFLFLLFAWRVFFARGIKFDTSTLLLMLCIHFRCLKPWLVYHSVWRVVELVVPPGLTLHLVCPYT